MKLHPLSRKTHYWIALAAALPVLVILTTGILLQVKKQVPWVQPPEKRGESKQPEVSFEKVLAVCRAVPEAGVQEWSDIQRLDVRPSRGLIKVIAKNGWEVQVDARSGAVMQVAYRRSDMIEAMHDGTWFHEQARYWVFLPAGCGLLVLWITGLYLWWVPVGARRRKRKALATRKGSTER